MDSNSWEIVESPSNEKSSKSSPSVSDNKSLREEEALAESSAQHSSAQRSSAKPMTQRYGQNVKNYETEWRDLLMMISSDSDLKKLKSSAVTGDLKVSKFRSITWNVLLGALSTSPDTWKDERAQQRSNYREIKERHILNPERLKVAEGCDNPLSQSKDSIWNQHFRDTELRNLIQQDVVRTNPNVDFYRKENVQEIMINILFCYARQYPAICYRQGMHEILAPLIFVLHCDHQSLGHIQEETNIALDPVLVDVLSPQFVEEDSYFLFSKIMDSLELFYRINDMTITESGQLTNLPPRDPDRQSSSSPPPTKKSSEIEVVHQLNMVRDKIFAKQDLHLHNHLLKLEIPLALFGIRWLRLLFGREFFLFDLLILWDAIFGVGDNLKFTYYIVVAMLIHIRDRLLSNDYTTCLTLLMRYPTNADVGLIIRHALYMCEPDKYQCPPNAFVYVINSMRQRPVYPTRVYPPLATIGAPRPTLPSPRKMSEDIRREQAKITQRAHSSEDSGVVEGYSLNDPEVLKIELQDSYNVMAVSRLKLLQYLSILRRYIPGNQVDELHQTLDGIEELCSLLKPKHQYLFSSTALPVDPAFEANDEEVACETAVAATASLNTSPRSFPIAKNVPTTSYEVPNVRINRQTSQMLQKNRKEVEMDLIRSSVIGCVDLSQYPQENPAADRKNSGSD